MLVGHRRSVQYLERVLERGRVAHAYLFHGPDAVGKKTLGVEFAKSLLCPVRSRSLGGSSECESCRAAGALVHPDLIFLSPENLLAEGDNQREIGIKNIRELRRKISQSSWGNGKRVAIIDGAESLSREAQSALLKTLEEPAGAVTFLLITSSPGALLPTIHSRSISLGFSFVGDEDMQAMLEGANESERAGLLRLAAGRPGVLAKMIAEKDFGESVRADEIKFQKLLLADLSEKFSFSEQEARAAGRLEEFMLFLIRRMRGEMIRSLGVGGRSSVAPAGIAAIMSRGAFLQSLISKLNLIQSTAVNRRLVADSIFFDMHSLLSAKTL